MLSSFSKFSTMIKISARIENLPVCFLGLFWRGLDLVWDGKNICRKIKKFPGPCANVCADSASSRSYQLDQSYLVRDQILVLAALIKHCSIPQCFQGF